MKDFMRVPPGQKTIFDKQENFKKE